jgi:hypothetical protein
VRTSAELVRFYEKIERYFDRITKFVSVRFATLQEAARVLVPDYPPISTAVDTVA